ncbi:hypothetical protein [Paenibacillus kandeliae]|uniref:hypothetical protein n=1 Tax=Paenibacillus kandeliae TaxID=3231269 RepID=UPI0034596BFF
MFTIKNTRDMKPQIHNLQSTIRHTEIQLDHQRSSSDQHRQVESFLTSTRHALYQLTEQLGA